MRTDKENAILETINKDYTILYPGEDYEVSVSDIVEYTKKKMIDKACDAMCYICPAYMDGCDCVDNCEKHNYIRKAMEE